MCSGLGGDDFLKGGAESENTLYGDAIHNRRQCHSWDDRIFGGDYALFNYIVGDSYQMRMVPRTREEPASPFAIEYHSRNMGSARAVFMAIFGDTSGTLSGKAKGGNQKLTGTDVFGDATITFMAIRYSCGAMPSPPPEWPS